MIFDKHTNIKIWISVFMITLMVMISEFLGEKEMLFPEFAALAVGGLIAPKQSWIVNRERIMVLMSLSSVTGFLISVYIDAPLYLKLLLGIIVCTALLLVSQSTMLPLFSACILPILTEVDNIVYPISVILLTSALVVTQWILEKKNLRKPYKYIPVYYDIFWELKRWLFIICVLAVMLGIAVGFDIKWITAPPIIVAFCEFSYIDSKIRKRPLTAVCMIALSACVGTCSRLLLCSVLGLPLFVSAFVTIVFVLYLMAILEVYFPPAGAVALLPLISNPNVLTVYPIETAVGSIVFITLAMLWGHFMTKGEEKV